MKKYTLFIFIALVLLFSCEKDEKELISPSKAYYKLYDLYSNTDTVRSSPHDMGMSLLDNRQVCIWSTRRKFSEDNSYVENLFYILDANGEKIEEKRFLSKTIGIIANIEKKDTTLFGLIKLGYKKDKNNVAGFFSTEGYEKIPLTEYDGSIYYVQKLNDSYIFFETPPRNLDDDFPFPLRLIQTDKQGNVLQQTDSSSFSSRFPFRDHLVEDESKFYFLLLDYLVEVDLKNFQSNPKKIPIKLDIYRSSFFNSYRGTFFDSNCQVFSFQKELYLMGISELKNDKDPLLIHSVKDQRTFTLPIKTKTLPYMVRSPKGDLYFVYNTPENWITIRKFTGIESDGQPKLEIVKEMPFENDHIIQKVEISTEGDLYILAKTYLQGLNAVHALIKISKEQL